MLNAVPEVVTARANVTVQQTDFLSMPGHAEFNLIVAAMVLHHQPSPARFLAQASRMLHAGGQFLLVELAPHPHEWVKQNCGDLWLGFSTQQLKDWAQRAGLTINQQLYFAQRNGFTVQVVAFSHSAQAKQLT